WPLARTRELVFYPRSNGTLAETPERMRVNMGARSFPRTGPTVQLLRYVPTSGIEIGGPVVGGGGVAPRPGPSDAYSLVYETPVGEEMEILGLPHAILRVSADAPLARWFARLSDVAPDGTVTLVAGAGFNGAHRTSSREPSPLAPNQP